MDHDRNDTTRARGAGGVESMLRAIVDRHESEGLFAGAVLVARGGDELLAEARGFAHRGFSVPNTLDTRFDTASLSKLLTAVAAFRLVDRGLLGLDESVRGIVDLPEGARIPADVTIRHCLTHSSGIADDADEEAGEDYEEIWKATPCYMVRETLDFLPQFVYKEPLFPAGTQSRYNNCAYVLVGLALERRSGLGFRELIAREVLGPAGMASSGYFAKDGVEPGVAEGYATVKGPDGKPSGFRKNVYSYPPIGSPDAGAFVTVRDLERLFEAIEGGSFLAPESRVEFLSPRIDALTLKNGDLRRHGYCLEHDFDPTGKLIRYGKDGVNPGVAATAMRYPAAEGFVAILANQDANVWTMCRELAGAAGFAT
jgi:CubicO group peptidase (beta-lactamase class C family)